ncbi:hypothetical protein JW935_17280 [candidate division KSB1 bacterium]|nr:hypothetical protein [candidate division KSB1 bacterium]
MTDSTEVVNRYEAAERYIVTHDIQISNLIDNRHYRLTGRISFLVDAFERENSEFAALEFPAVLQILTKDDIAGEKKIDRGPSEEEINSGHISRTLHDRRFDVEFKQWYNIVMDSRYSHRRVAVELGNDLVAFFKCGPDGLITDTVEGDLLIK